MFVVILMPIPQGYNSVYETYYTGHESNGRLHTIPITRFHPFESGREAPHSRYTYAVHLINGSEVGVGQNLGLCILTSGFLTGFIPSMGNQSR